MARTQLTEKLNRLKKHIGGNPKAFSDPKIPSRYLDFAKSLGGKLISNQAGNYCLIRTLFPIGYRHGSQELTTSEINSPLPLAAFDLRSGSETIDFGSVIFVDTETTGLGGAGAVAFLVGVGRIIDEGFELLQYIIPDYSDEAAMLENLNKTFSEELTVISFNGKSFDLPLLTDRLIINRVGRKLSYKHHLDLLHSSRRLFKRRLQSCTLINLERELFALNRTDDIPGYLVPSVFFDWLNSDDLSMMNAVIEHNRLDIISLFFLARQISEAYSTNGSSLDYAEDLHSLSRWYDKRKEREKIETVFDKAEMLSGDMSAEAILFYARSFKRQRKYKESIGLLSKLMLKNSKHGFLANIDLAVYYEHRTKDFHKAMEYAKQAGRCKDIPAAQKVNLGKRVKRLELKLIKSKLAVGGN